MMNRSRHDELQPIYLENMAQAAKTLDSVHHIAGVEAAIVALAVCCDGARSQDGVGFSGFDAQFGHSLAHSVMTRGGLTEAQHAKAKKLCHKYRKQLGDMGFYPSDLANEAWAGKRVKQGQEDITLTATVRRTTEKGCLLLIEEVDQEYWFPKSRITTEELGDSGKVLVTAPGWLDCVKTIREQLHRQLAQGG